MSNVDLAATVLDAADAVPGIVIDGRSRWYAPVRSPRFLYVEHSTGEKELYDHQVDPYQLRSRHADPAYQATMASPVNELHRLQACAGNYLHWP